MEMLLTMRSQDFRTLPNANQLRSLDNDMITKRKPITEVPGNKKSEDNIMMDIEEESWLRSPDPLTLAPSLLMRLGLGQPPSQDLEAWKPYSSVANVMSWHNSGGWVKESILQQEQWAGICCQCRRCRDSHSKSPPCLFINAIAPSWQPLTLFQDHLCKMGPFLTSNDSLLTLMIRALWNVSLLEKGRIMLPDLRLEVRLQFFAKCVFCHVRHVSSLLLLAIEQCMPFHITIERADIKYFAPKKLSMVHRMRGVTYLSQSRDTTP